MSAQSGVLAGRGMARQLPVRLCAVLAERLGSLAAGRRSVERQALLRAIRDLGPRAGGQPAVARIVSDRGGRPVLLVADHGPGTLVVRAIRRPRSGPEVTLLAAVHGRRATIRNIQCRGSCAINQGLGTAVLKLAESLLADEGVTLIEGALAPGDYGHRDRQMHFYRKNGYTVWVSGLSGFITKRLPLAGTEGRLLPIRPH